jgi:hypothetical protein
MAICFRCKKSDQNHETKMPSKRFEMIGGKKQEACEGFQGFDPKLLEVPEAYAPKVPIPVIQDV